MDVYASCAWQQSLSSQKLTRTAQTGCCYHWVSKWYSQPTTKYLSLVHTHWIILVGAPEFMHWVYILLTWSIDHEGSICEISIVLYQDQEILHRDKFSCHVPKERWMWMAETLANKYLYQQLYKNIWWQWVWGSNNTDVGWVLIVDRFFSQLLGALDNEHHFSCHELATAGEHLPVLLHGIEPKDRHQSIAPTSRVSVWRLISYRVVAD